MNVEEKLLDIVKKHVEVENVGLNSKLDELGLDSIDVACVLFDIENQFSIQFSDEEMLSLKTVEDLVRLIGEKTK